MRGAGLLFVGSEDPVTPEQLDVLHDILARPELRVSEGRGVLDAFFDPLRTAIWAAIQELGRILQRVPAIDGEATGNVGLVVALGIVVAGGWFVARLARGSMAAEANVAAAAAARTPRAEEELARAGALARAGDFLAAAHHRYLATLRRLDERGVLPFDRSLTNREHLRRAAATPAVVASLDALVAAFDRLWYGQSACSAEEYARFAKLADRVWAVAG